MSLQSSNTWGGTGNQIVISMQGKGGGPHHLYMLDFASDNPPQLFPGVPVDCMNLDPGWSFDGKRLAFGLRPPAKPRPKE